MCLFCWFSFMIGFECNLTRIHWLTMHMYALALADVTILGIVKMHLKFTDAIMIRHGRRGVSQKILIIEKIGKTPPLSGKAGPLSSQLSSASNCLGFLGIFRGTGGPYIYSMTGGFWLTQPIIHACSILYRQNDI